MKLTDIQKVYLIGIGGIGMSGLARYFHTRGCLVSGYDKTRTELTEALEAEGISISYVDEVQTIGENFKEVDAATLVIYTPAVPRNSQIFNFYRDGGFELLKRSQVLGLLSEGMFTIAIAGTHGKTTTSSMVTHLLLSGGNDCSAFLGGITSNYNTNIIIGSNNVMVVEADEYDRSFLTLHPNIAAITSMDADHLDIYGNHEHLTESFGLFANQVKEGGKVYIKAGLPLQGSASYSIAGAADSQGFNIRVEHGAFKFDFRNKDVELKDLSLGLAGQHNIENAIVAIQIALDMGVGLEEIRAGLASFKGVKRRFEYIVKTPSHIYIDDYAHHPEELRACFNAVRTLYPGKKLTAIFQPHLFTRTRDFADGFAEVLSTVDEPLLLEIYPARELPIEGIDSRFLLDKMNNENKKLFVKDDVLEYIESQKPELLVTVGAGDIDTLIKPLKAILTKE